MQEPHSGSSVTFQQPSPSEIRSSVSLDYAVLAEYAEVCKNPVDGIFAIPSEQNPYVWQGTIALLDGPYDGGIFRFELFFSLRSTQVPRVLFWPAVFHPLIDPDTGEFDLSVKYARWRPEFRLRDVLAYLKEAFLLPDRNGHKNKEAANMIRTSPHEYRMRIKMDIFNSLQDFSSPANTLSSSRLSFGPWIPETMDPQLQLMLETGKKIVDSRQEDTAK